MISKLFGTLEIEMAQLLLNTNLIITANELGWTMESLENGKTPNKVLVMNSCITQHSARIFGCQWVPLSLTKHKYIIFTHYSSIKLFLIYQVYMQSIKNYYAIKFQVMTHTPYNT